MPSATVEDYMKTIYGLQQRDPRRLVPMGDLASAMGVAPGTATSMIKTLSASSLVNYEPRGGVRLTHSGEQLALHVLRRHRLVELFLVKVLGLDWSQVHEEADQLEHAISDTVLERIDELLDRPSVDPHGDPIPTPMGRVDLRPLQSLSQCAPGDTGRIARVTDQDAKFLRFVDRHGLTPGVVVSIDRRDELADAVTVHPEGGDAVTIGTAAAKKILVASA
ncbi:MAG: DtxR family transcriptional regulator [Phycisphaeraceae bacterium]|nr:DtxR family transcriptional regulator [Phycisphaeraceae bacterium]